VPGFADKKNQLRGTRPSPHFAPMHWATRTRYLLNVVALDLCMSGKVGLVKKYDLRRNDNDNNNIRDNVYGAVIMAEPL